MATRFTSQGNAAGLLDVGNDAVEPIRKKRVVLNVWPGNKTRKQIGSALIKNLVVYDGNRVLDILPCHKESVECPSPVFSNPPAIGSATRCHAANCFRW